MAEGIIGVAASAITLAALFSSCIDCFSYFKAAQNCPREAESLLVKLDCEKARLLVWANTVGILQTDPHKRYSELADARQDSLIRRCIGQITSLLTDAQKLQDEYGGRTTNEQESQRYLAVLSMNSMSVFQSAKRTFFARAGTRNGKPGMLSCIKWAIRDAAKFQILIVNLREFVDHLIQLVPVPPETINSIVEEDIVSTVDIGSLRLIEKGCDESSYPQWSARASEAIRDSEIGTMDRRNLLEILGDSGAMHEANATSQPPKTVSEAKYSTVSLYKTFIVLTEKCLNLEAGPSSHCAESRIGSAVSGYPSQTTFTSSGNWNLGRRLLSYFCLPGDQEEKLQQSEAMRLEYVKINSDIPDVEKLSRLYVYCGPCACAINTARMLATDKDIPEYMDVAIRVDDRLTTSCRDRASTSGVLEAIRDVIEDFDARNGGLRKSLRAIDCPALERRLYTLEQEQDERVEPKVMLQNLVLHEIPYTLDHLYSPGVIIIVENDMCSESLNHAPILSQSRRPRAGEIYNFEQVAAGQGFGYTMSFISRFSRSKAWLDIEKARREASDHLEDNASFSQPSLSSTSRKRARSSSTTS